MTIKILEFPELVQEEIAKQLELLELYELSECSQRASYIVRLAKVPNVKLSIDLHFAFHQVLTIERNEESLKLRVYSGGPIDTNKALKNIEKLLNTFHVKIIQHFCTGGVYNDVNSRIAQIIAHRKMSIENLKFEIKHISLENFQTFMAPLNVQNHLEIVDFAENFDFQIQHFPKFLDVSNSLWLTMDNIIEMAASRKTEKIRVKGTKITNTELNGFIERWMSDEFPGLKEICIAHYNFQKNVWIHGREVPTNLYYLYRAGYQIQSKSGVHASLQVDSVTFRLALVENPNEFPPIV